MKKISLMTLLLLITTTQKLLSSERRTGLESILKTSMREQETLKNYAGTIQETIKEQTIIIEKLENEALSSITQFNTFRNNSNSLSSNSELMQEYQEKFIAAKKKIEQSIEKKTNFIKNYLTPNYQARVLALEQEQQESIGELIKTNVTTLQTKIDHEKKLLKPFQNTVGFSIKRSTPKSEPSTDRIMTATFIGIIALIGWYIYENYTGNINLLFKGA